MVTLSPERRARIQRGLAVMTQTFPDLTPILMYGGDRTKFIALAQELFYGTHDLEALREQGWTIQPPGWVPSTDLAAVVPELRKRGWLVVDRRKALHLATAIRALGWTAYAPGDEPAPAPALTEDSMIHTLRESGWLVVRSYDVSRVCTQPHLQHDSARRVGQSSQCGRVLTALVAAGGDGLTALEAARHAGLPEKSCWWKRMSELAQFGHAELRIDAHDNVLMRDVDSRARRLYVATDLGVTLVQSWDL
jgi:hypothetical protein